MKNQELLVKKDTDVYKDIFHSKTFWINMISIAAIALQRKYGFVLDEATQMQLLALINVWLRSITKQPVKWTKKRTIYD